MICLFLCAPRYRWSDLSPWQSQTVWKCWSLGHQRGISQKGGLLTRSGGFA